MEILHTYFACCQAYLAYSKSCIGIFMARRSIITVTTHIGL